ncbi:thiosulfate sulfurtransferase cysA2 [Mycobacterium tuberculosis]|nr:thiosulfate sulfurtransferase cysA2 [Mycobacterium tuberculosis]
MARCDVLVSADWAESNLHAPKVVFVEVDEDTSAYDRDHIAGAIKLDWRTDLQDPVKRDFVDAQQFSKLLSERGIANEDTVILYGGNNNWFAAYAYWYFKLYGHEKVKLLDGGRKKWELDGRPLSSDPVSRPVTSYTASPPDNTIRAFRDEVLAAINVKNLIDVRSPDEFSGKILAPAHLPQEQSQRPGHIPGAINVPWSRAANEDGTFKSDEELAKLYADAGLDNSKETIAYCRIGERSSHTWFVLRELLGHQNVKNYDAVGQNTAPWWAPRSSWEADMCSGPKQGLTLPASVDLEKETVITGRVVDGDGQAVGGAFVRLLDSSDEFTAEVVASATGDFRFFAAPGSWTLRALSAAGNGDAVVQPSGAGIHEVDVKIT